MSSNHSQQAVAAKIRARYGFFLKESDYTALAACGSTGEAMALLRENPLYADAVKKYGDILAYNDVLRYAYFSDLESLLHFDCFLGSQLYRVVAEELTVDLILSFCRHCNAGTLSEFHPLLPEFFCRHLELDFAQLCRSTTYTQLLGVLVGNPYYKAVSAVVPKQNEPINLNELEFALFSEYYRRMARLFEKTGGCKKAAELFAAGADVKNLQRLLRAKARSSAPITRFLPQGNFSQKRLEAWGALSYKELEAALLKTSFQKYRKKDVALDFALKAALYERGRKTIRFTREIPCLLVAYLFLARHQMDCIAILMGGVSYQMEPVSLFHLLPLETR